ncbi:MAG: TlpA family protein disulfide reductase [Bacteroides sp.]|nr:TlpA family protein disulfide reductase [Bacteroides sp.]MCM1086130.1 TlpA family protein disulfide reductase [Bacteroides sp.]
MKKLMKMCLPIGMTALMAACAPTQKELLYADFGKVQDDVYLSMVPLAGGDNVYLDTISLQDGKFLLDREIAEPTEVTLELGRDRKAYGRRKPAASEAYRVNFLLQPGEKVRIKAAYGQDCLDYELSGSRELKAQSDLRTKMRAEYVELGLLYDKIVEAMKDGVENADEAYIDSLYEAYGAANIRKAEASLHFIKENADRMLSAFLLLKHPDRDTFLNFLPVLDSALVHGALAEKIEQVRRQAEYMRTVRQNEANLSAGAQAPDFTLYDLNGKAVRLSDFSNRYVVLDFWGTWCPWCVKGIPQMKEYYAKHKKKVAFISIACRDKAEKVKAMVEKEGIKWVNVMNGEGEDDMALTFGVSGYPTKILLAPGMKVQNRYLGEVPEFYQDLDNIK